MSQTLDNDVSEVEDEEIRIRRWRRSQFMRLGFGLRDAQRLTVAPVDLGQTRKLIASGCAHEIARRILL